MILKYVFVAEPLTWWWTSNSVESVESLLAHHQLHPRRCHWRHTMGIQKQCQHFWCRSIGAANGYIIIVTFYQCIPNWSHVDKLFKAIFQAFFLHYSVKYCLFIQHDITCSNVSRSRRLDELNQRDSISPMFFDVRLQSSLLLNL